MDTKPFRIPITDGEASLRAIENKLNQLPIIDFDESTNTLKVYNRTTGAFVSVVLS